MLVYQRVPTKTRWDMTRASCLQVSEMWLSSGSFIHLEFVEITQAPLLPLAYTFCYNTQLQDTVDNQSNPLKTAVGAKNKISSSQILQQKLHPSCHNHPPIGSLPFKTPPFSTSMIMGERGITLSRWWFQTFFIFTPIWGRFPFWLAYFSDGWFNHQPAIHPSRGPFFTLSDSHPSYGF